MTSATDRPFGWSSLCSEVGVCLKVSDRQTDRETDGQGDRRTDRETGLQTNHDSSPVAPTGLFTRPLAAVQEPHACTAPSLYIRTGGEKASSAAAVGARISP